MQNGWEGIFTEALSGSGKQAVDEQATVADGYLDRLVHNAQNQTQGRLFEKTGRFPPELLDGYDRSRWTICPLDKWILSPGYAVFAVIADL
ncbi:MAG: hypothetical protein R6T90_06200 [Dissulfuribacterales bacterium]